MEHDRQKIHKLSFDPRNPVLYFQPDYLNAQQYPHLKVIVSAHFFTCFSIAGGTAKSLPKSPFGGIYTSGNEPEFLKFYRSLENELKQLGVEKIIFNQPPAYYPNFVPTEWLLSQGYDRAISETNQFITISGELHSKMHKMEKRKLKKRSNFSFNKTDLVPDIHHFIAECRKQKGLEINITAAKLAELTEQFPDRYQIFEARKDGQLAAAVVMTVPVDNIAYYYLPATNPAFKRLSPMVSLMDYIYHYYQTKKMDYLDLGISSVNGKLQESLFRFKARMGADATSRMLLVKNI